MKECNYETHFITGVIVMGIVAIAVAFWTGHRASEHYEQRAIKAQVGYYDSNTSEFKFKGE